MGLKPLKILLVPSLPYLADDSFIPIAEALNKINPDNEITYFHAEYFLNLKNEVKDHYAPELLPPFVKVIIPKDGSKVTEHEILLSVRNQIKEVLKDFKPDRLVFITDKTYAFRVFEMFDSKIPKIVIQPSTRTYSSKSIGLKRRLKLFYERQIKGLPITSLTNSFGIESKRAKYLFWTKFWFPPKGIRISTELFEMGPLPFQYKFSKLPAEKNMEEKSNLVLIILSKRSSISKSQFEAIEKMVESAIQNLGSSHEVIVKVHPREDLNYFQSRFAGKGNAKIIKDANSTELVNRSSLILAPWSTLIYEALFLEKKFILLNPQGIFDLKDIMVPDFKFIAKTPDEIKSLTELIFSKNNDQVAPEYNQAAQILIGDRNKSAAFEAAKLILAE